MHDLAAIFTAACVVHSPPADLKLQGETETGRRMLTHNSTWMLSLRFDSVAVFRPVLVRSPSTDFGVHVAPTYIRLAVFCAPINSTPPLRRGHSSKQQRDDNSMSGVQVHARSSHRPLRSSCCLPALRENQPSRGALSCFCQRASKRQAPNGAASRRRQPQGGQKGGQPLGESQGVGGFLAPRVKGARVDGEGERAGQQERPVTAVQTCYHID